MIVVQRKEEEDNNVRITKNMNDSIEDNEGMNGMENKIEDH